MNKVLEFFKKLPNAYYNWKKRNEQLSIFLSESEKHRGRLSRIDETVANLDTNMKHVKDKIQMLENQIDQVNGRLENIGKGTMMELFDTLHDWRVNFVLNKKWASPAEKHEVGEIYRIYHDELHGNGQGERYYKEIIALPESEEELKQRSEHHD